MLESLKLAKKRMRREEKLKTGNWILPAKPNVCSFSVFLFFPGASIKMWKQWLRTMKSRQSLISLRCSVLSLIICRHAVSSFCTIKVKHQFDWSTPRDIFSANTSDSCDCVKLKLILGPSWAHFQWSGLWKTEKKEALNAVDLTHHWSHFIVTQAWKIIALECRSFFVSPQTSRRWKQSEASFSLRTGANNRREKSRKSTFSLP